MRSTLIWVLDGWAIVAAKDRRRPMELVARFKTLAPDGVVAFISRYCKPAVPVSGMTPERSLQTKGHGDGVAND